MDFFFFFLEGIWNLPRTFRIPGSLESPGEFCDDFGTGFPETSEPGNLESTRSNSFAGARLVLLRPVAFNTRTHGGYRAVYYKTAINSAVIPRTLARSVLLYERGSMTCGTSGWPEYPTLDFPSYRCSLPLGEKNSRALLRIHHIFSNKL